MEARIPGMPVARAEAVFEWLEGGAFLIQHADAEAPTESMPPELIQNSPFPLVTIIAVDDASDNYAFAYADARGVRRVYKMSLSTGEWKIWGQSGPEFFQRFSGTFADNGERVDGRWERSVDGEVWELDFNVVYAKVGSLATGA